MKNISKRIFSLLLGLVLTLSCSTVAFANETTDNYEVIKSDNADFTITPLANQQIVGMHVGKTSTSLTSSNFSIVSAVKKAQMSVEVTVNSPCVLYVFFKDSNGKSLGASTLTMTRSGSFTMIPTPSSLGSGKYSYQFKFDKSGINYQLYVKASF